MATMKRGERSVFTIDPEYGYGSSATGSIPANSTLIFEVEMLDFKDKEKDKWDCSLEERIEKSETFKLEGNKEFKAGNFISARKHYENAYEWIDTGADDNDQANKLKTQVASNLAAVYIKLKGIYKFRKIPEIFFK